MSEDIEKAVNHLRDPHGNIETQAQRAQRHKIDMDAGLRHRGDPVPAQEDVAAATIEEIRDRELRDYSCAATAEEISGWRNGWACAIRTLPITTEDEPLKAYHKGWGDGVKSAEIGIAARMRRMEDELVRLRQKVTEGRS